MTSGTVAGGNEYGLTDRELQVLRLLIDGQTTKEIAAALGITFKTGATHRMRILEKMGVHKTASIVRLALSAGLDR
jgi:DNA-binding CsgD family transcriptional regulator